MLTVMLLGRKVGADLAALSGISRPLNFRFYRHARNVCIGPHRRARRAGCRLAGLRHLCLFFPARVTDLSPVDTEAQPFYYTFKVQCTSCREVHPNPVTISRFV